MDYSRPLQIAYQGRAGRSGGPQDAAGVRLFSTVSGQVDGRAAAVRDALREAALGGRAPGRRDV